VIDRAVMRLLEWAAGHADEGRYSPVAIAFHWTMAALIFVQLGLGWWMGRAPAGPDKAEAYGVHFAIGILMLALAAGRLGWRTLAPGPINDADKPGWQTTAAHITHGVFYVCLLGLPLSGWLIVSATARDQPLTLLGLPWPLLPLGTLPNTTLWGLEAVGEWIHRGLIVSLLLLVPLHIAAALEHHFIARDDVLHGMLPIVEPPPPRRTGWQRRFAALEQKIASTARWLWPRPPPGSRRRRRPT
jgi:cytochrome b561